MNKKHWTQNPKVKWESLIIGETKCIKTRQKKEMSNTLNPDLPPNRTHSESTDGVDSLKTQHCLSRGTAAPLYSLPADWLQPAEGEQHRCTQ